MNQTKKKTLEQVVEETARYPMEAFDFVRHGLTYTVNHIHGDTTNKDEADCHVSGKQLSQGLRDYALLRYGLMARPVLQHWGIYHTIDFGRIVYAMVDNKLMQKTDHDDVRDFESVFDFDDAFEPPTRPRIAPPTVFHL